MIREQRLIKRILDEIGDEFEEYISTFYVCDLWKIKENEVIVNKTFKRILDIVADFNLTTSDDLIGGVYKLIESPVAMMHILEYMTEDFIKNGSRSLLNRTMVFCYSVYMICYDLGIKPNTLLERVVNSDIIRTKTNIWIKIKHFIGLRRYPYEFEGDPDALLLISVLRGSPMNETLKFMAEYKELV